MAATMSGRSERVLQTVEHRTKAQSVYEALRSQILSGRLLPGEKLDQAWLARMLNVSRMPLRQALLMLEADGLIESRAHYGSVVSLLNPADLLDIYMSRRAIETMLAEEGSKKLTAAEISRLQEIIALQRESVAKNEKQRYAQLDKEFHLQLYRPSGFNKACEIYSRLRDLSDRYFMLYSSTPAATNTSILEHAEIVEHCMRRDPAAVRDATANHISRGLKALLDILESGATATNGGVQEQPA